MTKVDLVVATPLGADLYFGRLDAVAHSVGGIDAIAVDPAFVQSNPQLCTETIVFSGVPGKAAAVYAVGLGAGWLAAEGAPAQQIGVDKAVHQQFVSPPAAVGVNQSWAVSATLQGDSIDASTKPLQISLRRVGHPQTWQVADAAVVCG